MALTKSLVLRFILKQRRQRFPLAMGHITDQFFNSRRQVANLFCRVGCPQRDIIKRVFRADTFHTQYLVKAFAQHGHEGQRPAEIKDFPFHGPPLGQAADGLVDHGIKNAGRNVALFRALVEQGLNIALGKHAAAGSDRINPLMLLGQRIHIRRVHIQQRGHLVDERASSTGTSAVHARLHSAAEENNLGVLPAQFDDTVRAGHIVLRRHFRGIYLLHKLNICIFRHAHAGTAGNGQTPLPLIGKFFQNRLQHLHRFGSDLRKMALISLIYNLVFLIQHNAFDRCGTHIQTDYQSRCSFLSAAASLCLAAEDRMFLSFLF